MPKLIPLSNYGDLIAVDEFVSMCDDTSFIDYDGFGYWATEIDMFNEIPVIPSTVKFRTTTPPRLGYSCNVV